MTANLGDFGVENDCRKNGCESWPGIDIFKKTRLPARSEREVARPPS